MSHHHVPDRVKELQAPTEPHDPECLHCVLIAAASKFQKAHEDYPADEVMADLGSLVGCVIGSLVYGNPHLTADDAENLLRTVMRKARVSQTQLQGMLKDRTTVN